MVENGNKNENIKPTEKIDTSTPVLSDRDKKNQKELEAEYLRQEQEQERKRQQREWAQKKEREQNERLDRIENSLNNISDAIVKLAKAQSKTECKSYETTFEDEIRSIRNERLAKEERQRHDPVWQAEFQYSLFCAWCNAYRPEILSGTENKLDIEKMKNTSYINPNFFKDYFDEIGSFKCPVRDDVVKRIIAEKYFGYEYYTDKDGNLKARRRRQSVN